MKMNKILIDINELSELLSVKPSTIYWWCSIDFIPHVKLGRLVRFEKEAVLKWLEKNSIKGRRRQVLQDNLGKTEASKKP
jgi:excisionase family DNA binding protein